MYKLGLAPSTLGNPPAYEMIAAASAAGFDKLGLRMYPPPRWHRADPDDLIEDAPIREIAARLKASGVTALSLNAIYLAPETDDAYLIKALDDAAVLEAEFYQVVVLDSDRGRAVANFARAAELAKVRGLRLSIEFKDDSKVETIGDTVKFLKEAGQPAGCGICLDTLHLSRSGGSPGDLAHVEPGLIDYVELSDAPAKIPDATLIRTESRMQRLLPGAGELWLDEVIDAVPKYLTMHLECPGAAKPGFSHSENAKLIIAATRKFLAPRG